MGLGAHRLLPPIHPLAGANSHRVSRFSLGKLPCMLGVFDPAVPAMRSRLDALRYCLAVCLTPSAPLILAISELTTSGYPAYMCPSPTLPVHRYRRPHMVRGQDGPLLLSCVTLSFTTSRRFIPTLSRQECLCTKPRPYSEPRLTERRPSTNTRLYL